MTNKNVRERLTSFYADAGAPTATRRLSNKALKRSIDHELAQVLQGDAPAIAATPVKTPAAVKRAAATNTRRRMVLHAGPELVTVSQLAKELGLSPSTIKKRVQQMPGAYKIGRAWVMTAAMADELRADPPKPRLRVKAPA